MKTTKAKPFMVRLPDSHLRKAYEEYCADNLRSLDAQASTLIIKELQTLGYLTATQQKQDAHLGMQVKYANN